MAFQATFMRGSLSDQIVDMFPDEGDPGLVVTGFVFRPVEDDDIEDDEEPEENLYVYEAHFNATTHAMVGNLSSKLLMHLEDCDTLAEAQIKFIDLVAQNQDPGPQETPQERAPGAGEVGRRVR